MNKKILIFLAIIGLGALASYFFYFREGPGAAIESFKECVEAGYPVLESYPRQCKTPEGRTFTEEIGNEIEKSDLIRVNSPRPNQLIESPLTVEGEAKGFWFFEGSFPVKLLDADGNTLAQSVAQAKSEWMTEEFVPFEAKIEFSTQKEEGTLVLEKDNPSGLPENADELRIPVKFSTQETITVKAFFNNSDLDPEYSCDKVFPVERQIPKTQAVGQAALKELLRGPTEEEKEEGYSTSINSDVQIQSLTIENGEARVDFNERLEFQVGGSCRVTAIRTQIEETLKQFPSVDTVVISIDGRTEDILQP